MSPKRPKAALLCVSDKTGIAEFATELAALGFELLAVGATARSLRQAELRVEEVSPLDPALLERLTAEDPERRAALEDRGLAPVELVAANLYPLAEVLAGTELSQAEVMEYVDVGTSALLREAARRFERVIAVCDPSDYASVLDGLREFGELDREHRQALAAKIFHHTAYYDATLAQYLARRPQSLPDELVFSLKKARDLRYGENPHQHAALYTLSGSRRWGLASAQQVHGKELHFTHYLDLDAALELVGEFREPACAVFRHRIPCGAATADRLVEALRGAYRADPQAAAAGAAALNREVDEETAKLLAELQLDAVLAPEFTHQALEVLRLRKDLRLLTVPSTLLAPYEYDTFPVSGGLLVEQKDPRSFKELKTVTTRKPSPEEQLSVEFAWSVAKHGRTHAAVLADGTRAVGIGTGEPTCLDALRNAVAKSKDRHPILSPQAALVLASDGPLPLRCLHEAAGAGVGVVVQPGGTSEDSDAVKACDQLGLAMVFTGLRQFRH